MERREEGEGRKGGREGREDDWKGGVREAFE